MAARPRKKKWGKALRWPAGMWRDSWARKLNWRTFWTNTFSIYASEVRHSLILLCLPPHRLTAVGGTAILVRRCIAHHSMPVPSLTHLQTSSDRTVKILTAYLSPSHLLIGVNLSACFCRWLLVLLAGDLNPKHVDWKSRLSRKRWNLLRDYSVGNGSRRNAFSILEQDYEIGKQIMYLQYVRSGDRCFMEDITMC